MNIKELEALGLTKEDVLNRVVDRVLEGQDVEEESISSFRNQVAEIVMQGINERVSKALEEGVLPKVEAMVDDITLQETNSWGEKKGAPKTFIEYLVERADAYIREPVNYQGKTRKEDNYNWREHSTRIAHMVHSHLQHSIERAMKNAVKGVNDSVKGGLKEAATMAINSIKVEVRRQ